MIGTKHLRRLVAAGIVVCFAVLFFSGAALSSAVRDKHRAHEQCKYLADAMEASFRSPLSEWRRWRERLPPPTLNDLLRPGGGEPTYLRRGATDLQDPWGNPFQLHLTSAPDEGGISVLVTTTAPDGTPISQHGIGPNAIPKP